MEDLNDFSEKVVWAASDYSNMKASSEATVVGMRCVLCNKGD